MTPTGYVLWEGTSRLDNKTPIVCVLTMQSRNQGTGNLAQTWILMQDIPPLEAIREDKDGPICGSCIHAKLRTCYVLVHQAPTQVWKTWRAGRYPLVTQTILKKAITRRGVRIGAYGDPAAVPIEVWRCIAIYAQNITGYTHEWEANPDLAQYCMASVESLDERMRAKALGFRTYRCTKDISTRVRPEEASCPKSAEAGHKLNCLQCGYCNGNLTDFRGDVVIQVHGHKQGVFEEWKPTSA